MFEVDTDRTENNEKEYLIRAWLIENFRDIHGQRWHFVYEGNKVKYYFRDEKDAELFKLMWL